MIVQTTGCFGVPGHYYIVGCLHEGVPPDAQNTAKRPFCEEPPCSGTTGPPFAGCLQITTVCATCGDRVRSDDEGRAGGSVHCGWAPPPLVPPLATAAAPALGTHRDSARRGDPHPRRGHDRRDAIVKAAEVSGFSLFYFFFMLCYTIGCSTSS